MTGIIKLQAGPGNVFYLRIRQIVFVILQKKLPCPCIAVDNLQNGQPFIADKVMTFQSACKQTQNLPHIFNPFLGKSALIKRITTHEMVF